MRVWMTWVGEDRLTVKIHLFISAVPVTIMILNDTDTIDLLITCYHIQHSIHVLRITFVFTNLNCTINV